MPYTESNSSSLSGKIIYGNEATWSLTSHTAAVEYYGCFCGAAALISYRHALTSPFVTIDIPCDDLENAFVIAGNTIIKKGQAFPINAIKYGEKGKDFPDIRKDANFTIIYVSDFTWIKWNIKKCRAYYFQSKKLNSFSVKKIHLS